MINVAVCGAAGRMGQTVCEAVQAADDLSLVGRADPLLDTALVDVLGDADVVVDFTTPDAAVDNARTCLEAGVHCVMGTTGADFSDLEGVGSANLFVAPNFAIGAVLMMELAQRVAPHMPECEIVELQQEQKLDAPSGTPSAPPTWSAGRGATCTTRSTRCGCPARGAPGSRVRGTRPDADDPPRLDRPRVVYAGVPLAVRKVASLERSPAVGREHLR